MMKKKPLIIISASAMFATVIAVGGSLGWFTTTANMNTSDNPIEGTVEDAYYARGTGTKEDPFIINKPRHLYNLAWLQFLGFYNKSTGIDAHQFYFELEDNIDMGSYGSIPPIGSEKNPFMGNFNGNGYVISNVTISNNFEDFHNHPSVISDWSANGTDRQQPHILGLFGIVGSYPSCNTPGGYSSATNEFINTGITGATIKSDVSNCLTGIAAGYVNDTDLTDDHYAMANIVVDNSKISLPNSTSAYDSTNLTANISDYSLVGYTNNTAGAVTATKKLYGINSDTNITFNATEEGNVQGWGGSIDMRTMYDGLLDVYNSYSSDSDGVYKYYRNRTIVEDIDGNEISNVPSNPVSNTQLGYTSGGDSYNLVHYGYEQKNSQNQVTASYTIARRDTSQYLYLYGHNPAVSTNANTTVSKTYYPETAAFNISLTVSGTTHYIVRNNTSITDTTTQANATKWIYDSDGYIRTSTDGETMYYLVASSATTLAVTTNQNNAVVWSKSTNGNNTSFSFSDGQNAYYIYYDGGWTLKQTEAPYYYIRSGTNNYLTRNGSNLTNQTSQANATKWYWSGEYFYPEGDDSVGLVYYYYRSSNWNATVYQLYLYDPTSTRSTPWTPTTDIASISGSATVSISVEGKSYSFWNGESTATYYLRYNNGWTYDTTSRTVTIQKSSSTAYYVTTPANGTLKLRTTETYQEPATYETKHTYFPLRQNNNDGTPLETNTGYVISGVDDSMAGDIRVSYYSKSSNLSNGVNTVYTINGSGRQTVTNNGTDQNIAKSFEKYADSKAAMANILNGTSNIYGLHFMNATIGYGEGVSAVAESATINGATYNNYELPTNCIDFNLKEKGYINFFAGTYFSGNNSFFSVFQVERDGNKKITNVKKISEVYSDGVQSHSYQYKFSDGTYSVPFKFNGDNKVTLTDGAYTEYSTMGSAYTNYTSVFKTSWIEVNSLTSNYAYYFEIPMNDGEYCLGSVDGGTGAYLMYLDIGANAAKTNRTIFYERFTIDERSYSYPVGVACQSMPSTYTSGTAVIPVDTAVDYSDSACVKIIAGASGDHSMDRDDSGNVILVRGDGNKAPPVYSGDDVVLYADSISQSNKIDPVPLDSKEYDVERMEYYDYTVNTDTLTVTTFTDYYDTNGDVTRTIVQRKYSGKSATGTPANTYTYDPRGDNPVDQRSSMSIYNTSTGVKYNVDQIINTSTVQIDQNKISSAVILQIKLVQEGGTSYEEELNLVLAIDNTYSNTADTYYKYDSFAIVVTPDNGTIKITVVNYGSTFSMKVYNYGTTTPTQTTSTQNTVITINGTTVTGQGQTITIP